MNFGEATFEHLDLAEAIETFHAAMDDLRDTALQEPPFMDPVEWVADSIDITVGFRKGKMRMTGFQRPVALAAMDPATDQITVIKGVQVGWSTFMKAMLFYGVSYLALSIIVTQPTDGDAEGYYKDQIEPHFSEDFFVGIRRKPKRGEASDTWNEHRFRNGGRLYFRGAASDDAFRRISAEWQMADEADAEGWQSKSEKRTQGDKLALYRDRGTAFAHPVMWVGSTPLERHSSLVWREWTKSSQERLHVSCPHCGKLQYLKWGSDKTPYGFRWKTDEKGYVVDCWYQCEGENACHIGEEHKEAMVEGGEYLAMNPTPNRPGHRGFHWPAWHSMAPQAQWRNLATQWLSAQDAKARGNVDELKRFINNVMAEPWDDLISGTAHDPASLSSLRVPYPAEVPDDVVVLTVGVDVQDNKEGLKGGDADIIASREATVYGWNSAMVYRAISHHVIIGEVGDPTADAELDAIRRRAYRKRDGSTLIPQATAHDMGSSKVGVGDAVKAYCAARRMENCWAVKGRNLTYGTRAPTVWPKKVSRNPKAGTTWYMIDTQQAKDTVGRMLRMRGPGSPMFPMSFGLDFFDGLAAESPVTDKKGNRYWKRTGKNTGEQWDCLVYAYAALLGLQASFTKWRNLNLAAKRIGVPEVPHDPETGELDYDGPDRSVQAKESDDVAVAAAVTNPSNAGTRPDVPSAGHQVRQDAPPARRKKVRVAKVIRSTRW